jgi:hypothetical protein
VTRVSPDRISRLIQQSRSACAQRQRAVRTVSQFLDRSTSFQHEHKERLRLFYLKSVIAKKLAEGQLPLTRPAVVGGGPANGGRCDACGSALVRQQLVIDVPAGGGRAVRLHADCFLFWDDVRHRILLEQPA